MLAEQNHGTILSGLQCTSIALTHNGQDSKGQERNVLGCLEAKCDELVVVHCLMRQDAFECEFPDILGCDI